MKTFLIATVGLTVIAGGALYAQQTEEIQRTQQQPDPEQIEKELDEKAKRIPQRSLAAALRARSDERSDRAEMVRRAPDLSEMREDLRRTSLEDQQNPQRLQSQQQEFATTRSFANVQDASPPPPGLRPMAASRMQNVSQQEVDNVKIPVLVPAAPEVRNVIKVYGMENVYTATAQLVSGAFLSISGTCNRVVGGDPDVVAFRKRIAEQTPRLAGTNAKYHMSRNDFGVDLSFSKFGCGYVMTIECDDPQTDPRCAQDDYITSLAASMILANPELAGGE